MDQVFYRKLFLVATIGLLGWLGLQILMPFASAFVWAGCLAVLLRPINDWLTLKLGRRRDLSAGILTAFVPLVLIGPIMALGIMFTNQIAQLATYLQGQSQHLNEGWLAKFERYPLISPIMRWISENTAITTEQLHAWISGSLQTMLQSLAVGGGTLVLGAVGTLVGFFLMLFLFYFLLRDGREMLVHALNLIPMATHSRRDLLHVVASTTRAVVYGSVLTALVQGAMVGIAFAITGLPSPVVFGVVAAALALLPAGGAAIVWVPAMVWLGYCGSWGLAIFMGTWGLVVSLGDNLLRPVLISQHAPVSTLAVFVGFVGGVSAFGPVGLIAGPVLLTLIIALLRFAEKQMRPAD